MRGQRSGNVLEGDSQAIRLDFSSGLTVARAAQDYSLIGDPGLPRLPVAHHLIDLSHIGALSKRGQAVLAAAKANQPLPDTTSFNFRRGLR